MTKIEILNIIHNQKKKYLSFLMANKIDYSQLKEEIFDFPSKKIEMAYKILALEELEEEIMKNI